MQRVFKKILFIFTFLTLFFSLCLIANAQTYSGTCGTSLSWSFDTSSGVLTISGNGDMTDYEFSDYTAPWYRYKDNVKEVILPEGITSIGEYAFLSCKKLENVNLPDSIIDIGKNAFHQCYALKSVVIPNGISRINKDVFFYCVSLQNIVIPNSVTYIAEQAFWGCESFTELVIPNSVKFIGHTAFAFCENLQRVTLSNGLKTISNSAFQDCHKLVSVIIPEGVTNIEEDAFYNCTALKKITLPLSLTTIEDLAFDDCINLEDVYYRGTESEWKKISKGRYNEELTSATIHYNSRKNFANIYSGPGTSYVAISVRAVWDFIPISVESGFCEIEFLNASGIKTRGYIRSSELSTSELEKLPIVIDSNRIVSLPTTKNYILKFTDVKYTTLTSVKIYAGPSSSYPIRNTITDGTEFKVLYYVGQSLPTYAQIEYITDEGVKRGYIPKTILDNIIRDIKSDNLFNSIKATNACFLMDGKNVYSMYSANDIELFSPLGNGWSLEKSTKMSIIELDFWKGAVAAISGNADNVDIGTQATPDRELTANNISAALDGIQMLINFGNGFINQTNFKINIEKKGNDNKVVIYMGTPIETPCQGESISGLTVLWRNGNYAISEDEYVRKCYPDLVEPDGKYSIWYSFASDFSTCPYGYSLVIKNDGCIYAYPIIHAGTSFPVYREINGRTEFAFDAIDLYRNVCFKIDDEVADRVFDELRNQGLESTFLQTTVKCPTDVTVYNDSNEIVVQTSCGNKVFDNGGDNVTIETIGSTKIIRHTKDAEISIETSSYGIGKMDYVVTNIEDAKPTSAIINNDIAIGETSKFKGALSEENNYSLTDINDGSISTKTFSDIDIDVYLTVTASFGGEVTGIPSLTYLGKEVSLTAQSYYGYAFTGWYVEDTLISEDDNLYFLLTEDVILEAKFSEIESICENGHLEYVIKGFEPNCTETGLADGVKCLACGVTLVAQEEIHALGHKEETIKGYDATCTEAGLTDGVKCSVCGETLTAQISVAAKGHKDGDGDYKCDNGCGYEYEKPEEPTDDCDHLCHKSGFMGFIWKIVCFFWKLFKMNPVCSCGVAHY